MSDWNLVYYETNRGDKPVEEFLDRLSSHERARVVDALDDLEEFGTDLTMPKVRPIHDTRLWEIRVRDRIQNIAFFTLPSKSAVCWCYMHSPRRLKRHRSVR